MLIGEFSAEQIASAQEFGVDLCSGMYIMVGDNWLYAHRILSKLGNGCQKAFYDDPNILYISLHVHMDGKFYPSGPEGDMYHCGVGAGTGK